MIAHVDGNPTVDRQGDCLLLTFPSGGEEVKLMLSLNRGLYLLSGLSRETKGIFSEQQVASVTQFPKRRRK